MKLFDFLFSNKNNTIQTFIQRGAIIIDVRSLSEYSQGAIPASKNMPLQTIRSKINDIQQLNKPVITCCASGVRSARAASLLKKSGIDVVNGGSWIKLSKKL